MTNTNDEFLHPTDSATETVFSRGGWIPKVIRKNEMLYVELGAGADANHEPRTFRFPITEAHLEVLKTSLPRHLLLWVAVLPLCIDAGTNDPFSDEAAMALLDPILFGSESEVESLFKENGWNTLQLVSQNADTELLEQGKIFESLKNATEETDWQRAAEYTANQDRARRGISLTKLDEALLKYTGQYIYRSGIPSRKPEAVEPELLPQVETVIRTAEQASKGMDFPQNHDLTGRFQIDKETWNTISDTVTQALIAAYPTLSSDTVKSISTLMCSEAASRARKAH